MSYEVYGRVEHHGKHTPGRSGEEQSCVRWAADAEPDEPRALELVSDFLRGWADELDPRFACSHCDKTRGEHLREGGLYRCFGRYGPITQSRWWEPPAPVPAAD